MRAYDTVTAALSLMFFILVGFVTTYGTSDIHLNAAALEAELQQGAEQALEDAGIEWASVSVTGQTAVLRGRAPSAEARTQAERVVLESSGQGGPVWGGIVSVTSEDAPVAEIPSTRAESETDSFQIESAVTESAPSGEAADSFRVVQTDRGELHVVGKLSDARAAEQVRTHLKQIERPGRVRDRLAVELGPAETIDPVQAASAVELASKLDAGEVRVQDKRLIASGIVMAPKARLALICDLSKRQKLKAEDVKLRGSGSWDYAFDDGALILSGTVATMAEKNQLEALAEACFSGDVRSDIEVMAGGYDDWVDTPAPYERSNMADSPDGRSNTILPGPSFKRFARSLFARRENPLTYSIPYGVISWRG